MARRLNGFFRTLEEWCHLPAEERDDPTQQAARLDIMRRAVGRAGIGALVYLNKTDPKAFGAILGASAEWAVFSGSSDIPVLL